MTADLLGARVGSPPREPATGAGCPGAEPLHPWTALRHALSLWWRLYRLGLMQWLPVYLVGLVLIVIADVLVRAL